MKRALCSGGTGFIGSALTQKLLDLGWEVLITGRAKEQAPKCQIIGYDFHNLDWDFEIDVLFHQAAISSTTEKNSKDYMRVNFDYPKMLFQRAIDKKVKSIVYASSCAVYGDVSIPFKEDGKTNPLNWYGESKLRFDEWVQESSFPIPIAGLRYSNVYGFGENHKGKSASQVYQIMCQMKKGSPNLFKYGEQYRDFVYISDVVEANLLAINNKGIFNVGYGEPHTFNYIVDIANKVLKTNLKPNYIENPWGKAYQNFTSCDLTKANKVLGYSPKITLEKGMHLL